VVLVVADSRGEADLNGGRIFIPVEDPKGYGDQHIWVVDKDEKGEVTKKKLYGVRYVPLTDAPMS